MVIDIFVSLVWNKNFDICYSSSASAQILFKNYIKFENKILVQSECFKSLHQMMELTIEFLMIW